MVKQYKEEKANALATAARYKEVLNAQKGNFFGKLDPTSPKKGENTFSSSQAVKNDF